MKLSSLNFMFIISLMTVVCLTSDTNLLAVTEGRFALIIWF